MKKLDNFLRFRDNEKFKLFNKVFTIIVMMCFVATMVLVVYFGGTKEGKNSSRPYVFAMLPLLLLVSFFRKNDYLFIVAEFVTIIADIFLILLGNINVGFPIYLIVQLVYATYFFFRDTNTKRKLTIVIFRFALMLIAAVVMIIVGKRNVKFIVGGMYYINIIINLIYTVIFKDSIQIIGFAIFLISDTFIALGILAKDGSTLAKTLAMFNFVYFTYLISQVILIFNKHNNAYESSPIVKKSE